MLEGRATKPTDKESVISLSVASAIRANVNPADRVDELTVVPTSADGGPYEVFSLSRGPSRDSGSLQNHSAVNHQDLTGHVIGRRRSQESDGANDVTGLGDTTEHDRSGKILHGLAGRRTDGYRHEILVELFPQRCSDYGAKALTVIPLPASARAPA